MPVVMHKIIHRLTLAYLIGIVPFAALNFIQGNMLIGTLISVICCNLLYIDISIIRTKKYNSNVTFVVLMPIVYFLLYTLVIDKGILGILWSFPTVVIVNFIMHQRQAMAANMLILLVLSPAMVQTFDYAIVLRMFASLTIVGVLASLFVNIINEQQDKLHQLAITDPLTGLLNRLTLEENITLAIEQHNRILNPMTIVSIDIDHFKSINDQHGHDYGDQVIIQIANLLQQRCRKVDKVYRLGGEEFLVILFDSDIKSADVFAQSIQQSLAEFKFEHNLSPTLSIGLAEVHEEKTWEQWLKHADENLYTAKQQGRNKIIS